MKKIFLSSILVGMTFICASIGYCQMGSVIANGQMPNVTTDSKNNIYIVFGSKDSLFFVSSTNKGNTYSKPSLISVLPGLAASHSRGPQIALTNNSVLVTAANGEGNIFSFLKAGNKWLGPTKVNDADTIAKEGLMALSADKNNVFATWLDLRGNRRNKIYGARSADGGKTWSKNMLVYASPETSVCECCKPSVAVKGNSVYVMFRNWLQGNRDLYLIKSADMGAHFDKAEKLGEGSWQLNGCPMDGGGIAVGNNGQVKTIWRRQDKIYAASPGLPEEPLGAGRGCTMALVNDQEVYAWTNMGKVTISSHKNNNKVLGEGNQPTLGALNNDKFICVWSKDGNILAEVLTL